MKPETLAKQSLVEMGRRVGLGWETFDDVKRYEQAWGEQWYMSQSWTQADEDQFRDWMIAKLKRKTHWGERMIEREVASFILNWGWRIEE